MLIFDFGMCSPGLLPSRSILAGSIFATYEISAYVAEQIDFLNSLRSNVSVSIHIDDLDLVAEGDGISEVVANATHVIKAARGSFVPLGLAFAFGKSTVVASERSIAAEVTKAIPELRGSATISARKLRVDIQHCAAKKRRPTLWKRFAVVKGRMKKISALGKGRKRGGNIGPPHLALP